MGWNNPLLDDWAVDEEVTAAKMDRAVKDNLDWIGQTRPHCQVRDATGPTGTASWVNPSWDAITTNVGSMAASSTGFVTASTAGFYLIGASCTFGSDGTAGVRALMLSSAANGGGTVYCQSNVPLHSGSASGAVASTMLQMGGSTSVYAATFVPTGFAGGVTNIRMWAIWMTT